MNQNTAILKPEPTPFFRWTVLVFISLAMFGNYYIYDSISPLADLLASQLHFTDGDIGLLQGIYSIPNIIMVLIGGFMIDRIGTKKASFIFSMLCMIGAFFTVIKGDIIWMAIGRLIFGLGAESLIVAVTTIIARWFKGKELSFAFGINLTIARLGTFTALNSPSWARGLFDNWQNPLWIACAAGIISVLSVLIYFILDRISERKYSMPKEDEQDKIALNEIFIFSLPRLIFALVIAVSAFFFIPAAIGDIKWIVILACTMFFVQFRYGKSYLFIVLLCVTFYSGIFPFMTFSTKFFIQKHFIGIPQDIARGMGGFLTSLLILATMVLTPLFGLLADKKGRRATLMIIGSIMLIPVYLSMNYIHVDSKIPDAVLSKIYTNFDKLSDFCNEKNEVLAEKISKFKGTTNENEIKLIFDKNLSEVDSLANVLKIEKEVKISVNNNKINIEDLKKSSFFETLFRPVAYFFNMILILLSYFPNLVIPMSIMGIAFSLIPAVMWPSVALIVDSSKLGTAYGLMTMIQNIGLAVFNLLIGSVNDATGDYTAGMWIFSSVGFFALFFAIMLKRNEKGPESHGLERTKK